MPFQGVVILWVLAISALASGGIGASLRFCISEAQITLDTSAMTEIKTKVIQQNLKLQDSCYYVPVIFILKDGTRMPENSCVRRNDAYDLLDGKTLNIYRSSDSPQAVYHKDELPKFLPLLLVGIAFTILAIIATKLFKKKYEDDDYIQL